MTTIRPLGSELKARLDHAREWGLSFIPEDHQQYFERYTTKLQFIKQALESGRFTAEHTYELQSLGILLGDAMVRGARIDFEWVEVEDEYGIDPAINVPETSILLFPLTMISKRVEAGEEVDIYELFGTNEEQVMKVLGVPIRDEDTIADNGGPIPKKLPISAHVLRSYAVDGSQSGTSGAGDRGVAKYDYSITPAWKTAKAKLMQEEEKKPKKPTGLAALPFIGVLWRQN
ncbi:DUF3806 domain-containing protein [Devriesea agamarum]|uniref:DUF3806 domain-containing protein n=1 Tax=Devriesea agamarum TaxID=472569 RepID=UPI0009FFA599|nr:DUF3806 domain-containing protein [Devriesea agamarum]